MLTEDSMFILYLLLNLNIVHPLPVVEPEHLPVSFNQAKAIYESKHNKPLKPVFRHKDKVYPPDGTICPHCGANHQYLSYNNGNKRTQIRCKVCENTFSTQKSYSQQVVRILSRLFVNALIVAISYLLSNPEIILMSISA